jgi:hypothetical protein
MLPRSFPACLFDGGHRVEGSEITADPALSRKYPTAAAGWPWNVRFTARQYSRGVTAGSVTFCYDSRPAGPQVRSDTTRRTVPGIRVTQHTGLRCATTGMSGSPTLRRFPRPLRIGTRGCPNHAPNRHTALSDSHRRHRRVFCGNGLRGIGSNLPACTT